MTTIKQAFSLFKIICKDTFQNGLVKLGKKQNKSDDNNITLNKKATDKKASKIAMGILIGFGLIMILFYIVIFSSMITEASIAAGLHEELLYTYLALAQLVVVFFGSAALLNYLYFSKDNQLLSSLPLSPKTIFIAKYAMAYISELLICLLFSLPLLITYGVVSYMSGIAINASFYIVAVIGSFLLPIFPLLIASIISIPLMYVVSFLKKRTLGNTIVIAIITLGVLALYLSFIGSVSGMQQNAGEDGIFVLTDSMANLFVSLKKYTIFNYSLVNALLNNNGALNFLIYFVELAIIFVLAIMTSSAFYNKGMRVIIEGSGAKTKNAKTNAKESFKSSSFQKAYIIKEYKNLLNTPSLFIGTFIGIVIIPIFTYIFKGTFNFSEDGMPTLSNDLAIIGMVLYMASILMASGNTVAIVGFSMEGKNLYLLKSLPINVKDIIKPKLIVSNSINVAISLVTAISICVVSNSHNIFIALLIFIVMIISGFGTCCNGIYNDLKNPNLHYKNVTELTKNNKRIIKPMLINVGIGFSYMILGMVFAILSDNELAPIYKYVIFFGVEFLINGLYAGLTWKNLIDHADEKYENLEV